MVAKTVPVSHDLTINGYYPTINCYTGGGLFRYIKSHKFVAGGRRWHLRYYPNGYNSQHNGRVTFMLYHDRDIGADEDKVLVFYKVRLLGPDGNPVQGYENNHKVIYDDEPSINPYGLISHTAWSSRVTSGTMPSASDANSACP
jgi:hypothetical protein